MFKTKIIEFFMLVPFLKKVLTDSDAGEVRRVENILIENKIPYRIKTYQTRKYRHGALDTSSALVPTKPCMAGTPSISWRFLKKRL